ncbi:hypothetical protein J4440_03730 [Candidatus Woesearchaeota archaeon]|nr:hypothetical protein [Candidatus Woesearchaeota archaeon]
MEIYFFEEFPNGKSLSKLELIKFNTKIFLADYSIEGFKLYEKQIKSKYKNVKELIYWPVLNINEGYWFSPFAKRKALLRNFHNLLKEKISILWDAELPRKRKLLITQLPFFLKNKRLIKSFFKNYKGQIYTAEYFIETRFTKFLFSLFGLQFDPNIYDNYVIKMVYTSVRNYPEFFLKEEISSLKSKYNDRLIVGLGCLDTGINGNESLLSVEQLERDLLLCKELGIKKVVLFRLSGLNKEYLKIINKFV